jgi:nicotinamide-nucleotide amidase
MVAKMKDELYQLAAKLVELLLAKNIKLVTAESCTGGWLAEIITAVPGSSGCFERGFVTYSNEAKIEMLGVNPSTIEANGAVSENTAREMADGAIKNSRAQLSLSITGIAGPTGGSKEKPVGTVCFGWKYANFPAQSNTQHFDGDRHSVREAAVKFALSKLLDTEQKGSLDF